MTKKQINNLNINTLIVSIREFFIYNEITQTNVAIDNYIRFFMLDRVIRTVSNYYSIDQLKKSLKENKIDLKKIKRPKNDQIEIRRILLEKYINDVINL